jgi:hypothetical protein
MSSCNCLICAHEYLDSDMKNISLPNIQTKFKICEACLNSSDPSEDFNEVKKILSSYNNLIESHKSYEGAFSIIKK